MATWGGDFDLEIADEPPRNRHITKPVYRTSLGSMFCGKSEKILKTKKFRDEYIGKCQLIFTSPPFPLNDRKKYGNLTGKQYVRWIGGFASKLRDFVTSDGSIVVEIGNAWVPGQPVMSTIVMEALLRFLKKGGFHLCQEFVWYNPARLPSPVQWVNIERTRVKDAFTRIWWMSPTERPKADNRRILKPYSQSMKKLLESGRYNSGLRPSEHRVGTRSFAKNNGGAIPPNVLQGDEAPNLTNFLKGSNTKSNDGYQKYCRSQNIGLHPARMPPDLADFFIKFLTEPNDFVFDPFAGSNTTGACAEALNRKWVSCEAEWSYASSSTVRFDPESIVELDPLLHKIESDQAASSSNLLPNLTS